MKLEDLRNDERLGKFSTDTRLLDHWLDRWFRKYIKGSAHSTEACNSIAIEKHIKPYFQDVRLCDLSKGSCDDWLTKLRENGVGQRSIQQAFSVLNRTFSYAVKLESMSANPLDALDKPQAKRKRIMPFKIEEVQKMISSLHLRESLIVEISGKYGLRQGEVLGLQWGDLQSQKLTLTIERQVREERGVLVIKQPKTETSYRTISITEATFSRLQKLRSSDREDTDFIFTTNTGKPVRPGNFRNRVWNPMLKNLSLTHRGFHHLRHTYATLMLDHGEPVKLVSEILGHANVSVTMRTYSHWIKSDLSRGAEAARSIFE